MSNHDFRVYIVYKNHKDEKNWLSNERKIMSIITNAKIILLPTVISIFFINNNEFKVNFLKSGLPKFLK